MTDKTLGLAVMLVQADGTPISPTDSPVPTSDSLAAGTRSYDFASATRAAVGSASVRTALGALGAQREIMLTSSADCHIRFGDSTVSVAATDAQALRLFAGERFHLRVPSGVTHYAVIRDAADGFLRVTPVA
jgi:hypothetical protein